MPYIEKVTRAGRTVLYERSYSTHIHPPGATRSEKYKTTKESQKKINLRKVITELTILMNANFKPGDYHLVLTYEKDKRADTVDKAKKDRTMFLAGNFPEIPYNSYDFLFCFRAKKIFTSCPCTSFTSQLTKSSYIFGKVFCQS